MNEVWNLDPIYRGFDDPAFGQDLTMVEGLEASVAESYQAILSKGMNAVMTERFGG